jgi:hypothetical protein
LTTIKIKELKHVNESIKEKPQKNYLDCGVFICIAGYFIIHGVPLSALLQEDIETYRDFILISLLEYKNPNVISVLSILNSSSDNNDANKNNVKDSASIDNIQNNPKFVLKVNENCDKNNEKRLLKLVDVLNREFEVEHKKKTRRICDHKLMETLNFSQYKELFVDLAHIFSLDSDTIKNLKLLNMGNEKQRRAVIEKFIESHKTHCCD